MYNTLMLTLANIRKNKSQSVSLLLFVLIAALLLNAGLTIMFGIGAFFDERAENVNAAHFTALYAQGADSIDAGRRFMETYQGVTEIEQISVIGGMGDYIINDTTYTCSMFFSRADNSQKMDVPSLIGESKPLAGDAIYVPYFLILNGNYEIGDDFMLNLMGNEMRFTVAGATEEIMFGAQMNNLHRFYISDERYDELSAQHPENGITLLSARLKNADDAMFFEADYNKAVSTDGLYWAYIYDNARQARIMAPTIAAAVITAFAFILLVVCVIVIRFRIANSIEESMTNIGAQKAVGYRNAQIIASIVLQFGAVALLGALIGIALAQIAIPMIMSIMESTIALVWVPDFDAVNALIALFTTLIFVVAITWLTARRINKLHPLVALRGGLTTHNFKKNSLPLEQARGGLSLVLAFKQFLQGKRQAVTIGVIVAAVTMASVVGLGVNHNMNEDGDNFARAFFGELPEINVMLGADADCEAFAERMSGRPEVRKVFGYETGKALLVDEISIYASVVEDCSLLEGNMLLEGRYPKHDNEIALGTTISTVTGKSLGDTVMVKSGDFENECIVTGIVQYMNANGFNGIIASAGMREVQPDFKFAGYNIYLREGVDTKAFIDAVLAAEDGTFDSVTDISDQISTMLDSMGLIFAAVAVGMVAVTAFVVILVLYLVIKTVILRRRRELGIQKAVGFTTLQLMNQIALNMTPSILLGALVGAAAGHFGTSPMMGFFLRGMGIVRVELPMPSTLSVAICASLVALAYAVSMLIAWRIRKISAYALVSE